MTDTPVKVTTIALSERTKNALEMFFARVCKNQYQLVEDKAELLIADLDNYEQRTILTGYRKKYPEIPTILLSVRDTHALELSNAYLMKKPLDLKSLRVTLNDIVKTFSKNKVENKESDSGGLPSSGERRKNNQKWDLKERRHDFQANLATDTTAGIIKQEQDDKNTLNAALTMKKYASRSYIGSNQDIDPFDEEAVKKISFHQDNFLYGHLYRLSREILISNSDVREMQLDTETGTFMISADGRLIKTVINDAKLRVVSGVPISWDNSKISNSLKKWENIQGEVYETKSLLWKTSLWASRGRIPVGTNLETPIALRYWPNLTRLLIFPHAVRIAAVWNQQPLSLIDTAVFLGIPQRFVFSFFTATQAIGASYNLKSSVDAVPPKQKIKKHRGIFSRILKHLKTQSNREDG